MAAAQIDTKLQTEMNHSDSSSNSSSNDSSPSSASASALASASLSSSPSPISSSSPVVAVCHPLCHRWILFYNNYGDWPPRNLFLFSTVEEFWAYFSLTRSPSRVPVGSNYHCFKEGIRPEWEDEQNAKGGKWTLILQKKAADDKILKQADHIWTVTLLSVIGEQYGSLNDQICGAVMAPRAKEFRISLWTRSSDEKIVKQIGEKWKALTEVTHQIQFQLHDESLKYNTSYRNNTSTYML